MIPLCIRWIPAVTNTLSVLVKMYANIKPGVQYGIKYNKSSGPENPVIICNPPKTRPDTIIKRESIGITFRILLLKIISSTNGAKITDHK